MRLRTLATLITLTCAALILIPTPADAQLRRIRDGARRAAERAVSSRVDRLVADAVRCALDDPSCAKEAEEAGEEVIYVDEDGEIITDDEGVPITDRERATASAPPPVGPGEGAWANYDFVPGDEILFFDDYANDKVGDFPRRMDLVAGSWEIVEWEGGRYIRATSGGLLAIPLPQTLPERFTVEYAVNLRHGNAYARLTTGRAYYGPDRTYTGSAPAVEFARAGLRPVGGAGPETLRGIAREVVEDNVAPVRIMADGAYMKMYVGESRVANAPNAVFPRSDTLFLSVGSASEERPILIGPIRVAGGGRDLYDRLSRDGRVATQGILFATDSDRIRPESTPTLEEIGAMLTEHPDLRISIEGHTDHDGDEAYNQELSERRAASVKRFLTERYGIDTARLETAGYGESQPAADNDSPEGKEQNRRVELVRLSESSG